LFSAFLGDGGGFAEAVEGGARLVVAAPYLCRLALRRDHDLLCQAHHRLEEVVVHPHLVVELIDGDGLGDGIEPIVAQIGTNQGGVLLFDEAIVVLVVGSAAGELNTLDGVFPEAEQVVIEELAAVALVLDPLSPVSLGQRTKGDKYRAQGQRAA